MGLNKRLISSEIAAAAGGSFEVVTYSGTSAEQSFDIGFEPDIIWIMGRNTSGRNYFVFDNSGSDNDFKYVPPASSGIAESANGVSTSGTGFTLQSSFGWNYTGITYVAWCFRAASSYSSNTNGSITSTVGANTDLGFSLVRYTGAGAAATVGHGLGSTPEAVFFKSFTARNWFVYHKDLSASNYIIFNLTNAQISDTRTSGGQPRPFGPFNSSTFGVNIDDETGATNNYLALCFHSVSGVSKIGSYTGTGAVNNQVNVGFQPRFVMQKKTSGSGSWNIIDNLRGDDNYLSANYTNAEGSMTASSFHLTSTGFTLDNSFSEWNASGGTYIYLATA